MERSLTRGVAGKLVVIYLADCWDDMWRRRQQLASRLAQADIVEQLIYVERPLPFTSFLKFLARRADRDGKERWHRVVSNWSWVMPAGEKLSVLTTFAPLPPIGSVALFRASERVRDRWLLRRLRRYVGLSQSMVCVSHPQMSLDVIRALDPKLLWYDCTEDFVSSPGLPDSVRAQIEATDRWLTEHADVLTAVSTTLYHEKRHINPGTSWLPNAVDTDLFLQSSRSLPVPLDLQGVSRPVLAFVGALNDWAHDWQLLDQVATLRPGWTILLIGELNVGPGTQRMLDGQPNVLCLGQKPYEELPSYLAHSDVCFQFYRRARANDTRNSQKLFLYLAAGKPVVSTPSADVQAYVDFVSVVKSAGEFVEAVHEALLVNDDSRTRKRQAFAQENSWAARTRRIEQLLQHAV